EFGDGGTSTDENPSHTYTEGGDFTVSLTVTGPGLSDTVTKTEYIHVLEPEIPYISEMIEPRPCERGDIIRIIGYNFGDTQGDSTVHFGATKIYGPGHQKIKLWTDTKIKVKVPKYNCSYWEGKEIYKKNVWVTVDGVDSNKRRIRILKPDTCP
ncbi:MAG: PKD domain-containing protein, partial [Deltaproteobacteria bacterium]|nr:PKD domain-containing protein [Deltaproteobacteria bacterium]